MANKDFHVKNGLVVEGGKIAVNSASANVSLDINASDAIQLPVGNTTQRPDAANGMIRYNSESGKLEIVAGGSWKNVGSVSASGLAQLDGETINVPVANQSQAQAGTNNDVAMTPLRTSQAIAAANIDASRINSGTIATARLGSGTANSSTFLRGDQTWQTVSLNGYVNSVSVIPSRPNNFAVVANISPTIHANGLLQLFITWRGVDLPPPPPPGAP